MQQRAKEYIVCELYNAACQVLVVVSKNTRLRVGDGRSRGHFICASATEDTMFFAPPQSRQHQQQQHYRHQQGTMTQTPKQTVVSRRRLVPAPRQPSWSTRLVSCRMCLVGARGPLFCWSGRAQDASDEDSGHFEESGIIQAWRYICDDETRGERKRGQRVRLLTVSFSSSAGLVVDVGAEYLGCAHTKKNYVYYLGRYHL